jgi:hypothetical protein
MIEERDLRLHISNDTCLFAALFLFRERDTTKDTAKYTYFAKRKAQHDCDNGMAANS